MNLKIKIINGFMKLKKKLFNVKEDRMFKLKVLGIFNFKF